MHQNKKIFALIPARGGSKGLPGKNIRPLAGIPLIGRTIEAAKNCRYIDRVFVSTDSDEIAHVALQFLAEVPFLRPPHLATDKSSSQDVILHFLKWCEAQDLNFDYLCLLQPTSPFRTGKHIEEAIECFEASEDIQYETLISVTRVENKYNWLLTPCSTNGAMERVTKSVKSSRRQDLPPLYLPNGAIYLARTQSFDGLFLKDKTLTYVMGDKESIDIDTIDDFKLAESYLNERL